MKQKLLIMLAIAVFTFISMDAWCQTKILPPKINISLSDKEYVEFYRKVDSLMFIVSNTSNAPATLVNPFLQRFNALWLAIDQKVALQMIDTTKKVNPTKKP